MDFIHQHKQAKEDSFALENREKLNKYVKEFTPCRNLSNKSRNLECHHQLRRQYEVV